MLTNAAAVSTQRIADAIREELGDEGQWDVVDGQNGPMVLASPEAMPQVQAALFKHRIRNVLVLAESPMKYL